MKFKKSIVGNSSLIKIKDGIYVKLKTYNSTGFVKDNWFIFCDKGEIYMPIYRNKIMFKGNYETN